PAGVGADRDRPRLPRGADADRDRRTARLAARNRQDANAAGAAAIAGGSGRRAGVARTGARAGANRGSDRTMMGAMDHDEVRELLQDAAIEPGGLDRLMAGDTPTAAVVAGHLAGCPDCSEEMERLRRSVGVIRPAVQAVPPPELRQKTLDYVAALGRPRGVASAAAASGSVRPGLVSGNRLRTLAALAAALIVAVTGTALVVDGGRDAVVRGQAAEIEALGDVARWTVRVDGRPDVRRVDLASTSGGATTGTLLFSPSSTELVVVSEDLAAPPANHEYRCWVD